jgi:hypothetical protein
MLTLDNGFTSVVIEPKDPSLLFNTFEANLTIFSPPGPPPIAYPNLRRSRSSARR